MHVPKVGHDDMFSNNRTAMHAPKMHMQGVIPINP